jgi:hypothetical protein
VALTLARLRRYLAELVDAPPVKIAAYAVKTRRHGRQ